MQRSRMPWAHAVRCDAMGAALRGWFPPLSHPGEEETRLGKYSEAPNATRSPCATSTHISGPTHPERRQRQHERSRRQNPHTAFTTSAGPQAAPSTCNHHRFDPSSAPPTCLPRTTSTRLASFIPNEHTPLDVSPLTPRTSPLVSSPFHRARRSQDYWSGRPADASTGSPSETRE